MIRTFVIAALLAAGTLHGAIKKAPDAKPETPPAEKKKNGLDGLAEELRKRSERDGGKLKLDEKDLIDFFRNALEEQGVPAEQLKNAGLPELLKLMKEKNPGVFEGLGFGGMPGFGRETEKKLTEHYGQLLEGHKPGTLSASAATFILRDAKKPADPLAFATCVRGDGWLLTKASEVSAAGELQCEIQGAWVAARVVRTWPEHDLALLQTVAKDASAVKWSERGAPEVGTFISAVAPAGREPVAIGIVSVLPRNEQTKGRGFLGVSLMSDEHGLKIREVVPNGPAKASGLQKEDLILELDGKKPESVFTFTKMVSDRKTGDKVRLKIQRGEAIVEKEIALGDRGTLPGAGRQGPDRMNSMGSTLSKKRTDFASVMQTDLPLQATQCGGPVTDLDGNVVGIVIARSGRVDTMVLPSETIRQALAGVDFSKEEKPATAKPEAPRPPAPAAVK
jgi:S1-C subfamily serine protease